MPHTKGTDFSGGVTKATENDFSNLGFNLIGDHLDFSKYDFLLITSTGGADPLKVEKYGDHRSRTYLRNVILAE
jgi:hypothetical protein